MIQHFLADGTPGAYRGVHPRLEGGHLRGGSISRRAFLPELIIALVFPTDYATEMINEVHAVIASCIRDFGSGERSFRTTSGF
jgi:hypothetical protein